MDKDSWASSSFLMSFALSSLAWSRSARAWDCRKGKRDAATVVGSLNTKMIFVGCVVSPTNAVWRLDNVWFFLGWRKGKSGDRSESVTDK
ncbi:hypothetical protein C8J56DRAFT_970190 [Mycena floridula]|nr:hypothetical protein C8J56DRAFT_970190 [Mycena floridula]